MTEPQVLAIVIVVLILMIFVRFIRRLVFLLIRLAIFFAACAVAITGLAILMNNETIFEKPGPEARIIRFLTMNSASTTEKGDGAATCNWQLGQNAAAAPAAAEPPAARSEEKPHRRERQKAERRRAPEPAPSPSAAASPGASPSAGAPGAGATPQENYYDELMTRSFPGISREKLFELSHDVANSLGGWKVVSADPRSGTLECLYTSRIFGFQDDVKITVTPKSEIELCSRSENGRPDSTSWLRLFPGDFGANIAHIKQFYETLEPKMDQVYKEQQEKENAKKPR